MHNDLSIVLGGQITFSTVIFQTFKADLFAKYYIQDPKWNCCS